MIRACYGHNSGSDPACGRRNPGATVTEYSRHQLPAEEVLPHGEGFDPASMEWCGGCARAVAALRKTRTG